MKKIKLLILLLIFSFLFCFNLCLAQEAQTSDQPINVSGKNFPYIEIVGIKILMPVGTVIGEQGGGVPYVSPEKFEPPEQQAIKNLLVPELEKAGYSVNRPSPLFGADESIKPRFLVGGGLVKWTAYYHPKTDIRESSVEVQWEIYDVTLKKVIYQATTDGYSSIDEKSQERASFAAMKISFIKFLSNRKLVSALENSISPSAVGDKTKLLVNYYASNKDMESAPDKIKEVMKSSFTINMEKPYGSGFIINPEGYALTNYHVVKQVSTFDAIFSDGKIIRGEVIKTFPDKDLALVKLSGNGYPYLPLRFTTALKIGEDVFAVGTPISMAKIQSVSKGIVSAVNNNFKLTEGKTANMIQTDASVNAGNTGGPLVDSKGFAIGINFFGMKLSEGLNYAISIDEAVKELGLTEAPLQK